MLSINKYFPSIFSYNIEIVLFIHRKNRNVKLMCQNIRQVIIYPYSRIWFIFLL